MAHARNDTLYRRVTRKGLLPAHVAEVGVHHPESSNVYRFIQDGVRATLVEPEPEAIAQIKQHFAARDKMLASGARVLGDIKTGAHGKPVLFLHPKDFNGTLVELEQI